MLARLLSATGGGSFTAEGLDVATLGLTNVKDHGATGNGTTDDTAAITSAIAALPETGGVLYFPPGDYLTSGGFTISKPCVVLGAGGGGGTTLDYGTPGAAAVGYISRITCNSATAVLFTVSESMVSFADLSLVCTATATDGAGIRTTTGGGDHAQYTGLTISGFYINIDHQNGREYAVERCWILDWVYAGIRHQNAQVTDEGEVNITSSHFINNGSPTSAGIEILTGGGIRVASCQFVGIPGIPYCIALAPTAATSNLLVTNCTFEGWTLHAIYGTGSAAFVNVIITGNEMQGTGNGGYEEAIKLANVTRVIITGNILMSTEESHAAINLTTAANIVIVGNYWDGYTALTSGDATNVTADHNGTA
jgi:hypothetical protein